VRDIAGNRLQIVKQPLQILKPEATGVGPEKKMDEWVEDF